MHLLVGAAVAASVARWTRRASALVRICFIVAPGSLIKVGATDGAWIPNVDFFYRGESDSGELTWLSKMEQDAESH